MKVMVEEETAEGGGGQGGRGAGIEGVDGIEAGGAAEEGTDPLAHCRKRSKRKTTGAGAGVKHAGGGMMGSMVGGVNGRGVGDADVEIKPDAVRGGFKTPRRENSELLGGGGKRDLNVQGGREEEGGSGPSRAESCEESCDGERWGGGGGVSEFGGEEMSAERQLRERHMRQQRHLLLQCVSCR